MKTRYSKLIKLETFLAGLIILLPVVLLARPCSTAQVRKHSQLRSASGGGTKNIMAEHMRFLWGIKNIHKTIIDFDNEEKTLILCGTQGGNQNVTFLTEIGVYRLLGISRKPIARKFQKWVFNILKEVRLNGKYELNNMILEERQMSKFRNIHRFATDVISNVIDYYEERFNIIDNIKKESDNKLNDVEEKLIETEQKIQEIHKEMEIEKMMTIIANDSHRKFTMARGEKIQRYSKDGKELLKTYIGTTEACRDKAIPKCNQAGIRNAIKEKAIYKGYRWAELLRSLPDDTIQDIGDTIEKKVEIKTGYVAMLDINKERIVKVYCDQKAAGEDRKFKSTAAVCQAIKQGRLSSGHYFKLWDDCDEELKKEYLSHEKLPSLRKRVNGKLIEQVHPIKNTVLKTFLSVNDAIKETRVSRRSLYSAIECGYSLKGYNWRYASS